MHLVLHALKSFLHRLAARNRNLSHSFLSLLPSSFEGIGNDIDDTKDVAHAKDDPDDDDDQVNPSPEVRLDQLRLLPI